MHISKRTNKPFNESISQRRTKLNGRLVYLTLLNLLIFAMWGGLSFSEKAAPIVVLSLAALTATTWAALIFTWVGRVRLGLQDELR